MREEDKLVCANDYPEDGRDMKADYLAFCKNLATAMTIGGITVVHYKPKGKWEKFFGQRNKETVRARKGSPLRQFEHHQFGFIHASLIRYFSARHAKEEIRDVSINDSKQKFLTKGGQNFFSLGKKETIEEKNNVITFTKTFEYK